MKAANRLNTVKEYYFSKKLREVRGLSCDRAGYVWMHMVIAVMAAAYGEALNMRTTIYQSATGRSPNNPNPNANLSATDRHVSLCKAHQV